MALFPLSQVRINTSANSSIIIQDITPTANPGQTRVNGFTEDLNGFAGTTHILSVDDVSVNSVEAVCTEAQVEGFIVVAIEDLVATDGCHIAVQGAGATPSFTGATLVVTFS